VSSVKGHNQAGLSGEMLGFKQLLFVVALVTNVEAHSFAHACFGFVGLAQRIVLTLLDLLSRAERTF
jgi:hypothetical protein